MGAPDYVARPLSLQGDAVRAPVSLLFSLICTLLFQLSVSLLFPLHLTPKLFPLNLALPWPYASPHGAPRRPSKTRTSVACA